ncbi:V-type ATP synthase subunit E [Spirochaetia bacterium]|nr:V-type ATP synthase subunit E [Spirochaetia bacterium]
MDIQLQELIEKIKKDGIESASDDAARIKAGAETESKRIIEEAKKEAERIIEKGKEDAQRSEKAGIAAIEQASRNLVLAFKTEIQTLLDKIVSRDTASAFNENTLKDVLPAVIKSLAADKTALDVVLNESQLTNLESWAKGALSAEFSKGLELKIGKVGAGFHIAQKDGSFYYDFSAAAVSDALSSYLNPKLAEILNDSTKGL